MNKQITHEQAGDIRLPEVFAMRMQDLLGEEYEDFLKSYKNPRTYGLRVNTAKISCEEFEKLAPFPIRKIPWVDNGYFYDESSHPARCPYYQAGLYYLQEPSAMTPASRLPVSPGEIVLDLCAAPGGKATALSAKLDGTGLLVANDISTSRARALLRNLELFGTTNSFVANEVPARLANSFPEYFHKILLDAPCSGEGMFRKEEALLQDWTPEKSEELSGIQRELLLHAADMLRPGGLLLYSTCTFSPQEDEQVISFLLEQRPEMQLLDIPGYEGFSMGIPSAVNHTAKNGEGTDLIKCPSNNEISIADNHEDLRKCVRIFPHKMNGEGHFLALLSKGTPADPETAREAQPLLPPSIPQKNRPSKEARKWIEAFFEEIGLHTLGGRPFDWNRVEIRSEKVYYLPPVSADFRGIPFLRNGLYLGDLKKNRFEPSQPFALALHKDDAEATIVLPVTDPRLPLYLKGESLTISPGEAARSKGWHLLTIDGYPLAFGKLVGSTLKNKYPAGWRM